MQWLLTLLGFMNNTEKKKRKAADLREKAFKAQRNGNLRLAGEYTLEAEQIENELFEAHADKKL